MRICMQNSNSEHVDRDVDQDMLINEFDIDHHHHQQQQGIYVDSSSCACSVSSDANIGVFQAAELEHAQPIYESFACANDRDSSAARVGTEHDREIYFVGYVRSRVAPLTVLFQRLQQSLASASISVFAGVQKFQNSTTWTRHSAFTHISGAILILALLDLIFDTLAHTF
jgi:hypothetical protein